MCVVEVGRVYTDMSGIEMLVLRDVPKNEVSLKVDPQFDYVEVVFAKNPNMSNGWRRKHDGKYPVYASWPNHPNHLIITKESGKCS